MKKLLFIVVCLLAVSCQGYKNGENIKNVKKGMTRDEVKSIMGEPVDSYYSRGKTYKGDVFSIIYIYEAPFASSDNIKITFDKDTSFVAIINDGR